MDKKIFQELRIKKKEIRKQVLVKVAENILHKDGLDAVTIRNVAEEAGLSYGAIYMYFKNKEELFLCMLIQNVKRLKKNIELKIDTSNPAEALRQMAFDFMEYYESFGKFVSFFDFIGNANGDFDQFDPLLTKEL